MVKGYWPYRILFFGCIALSISVVLFTVSSRQRGQARGDVRRPAATSAQRPGVRDVADAGDRRGRRDVPDVAAGRASLDATDSTARPASRVQITTILPFRREIKLYNFGDAAQDVSSWRLVSPHPGGEDTYSIPLGVVLLAGEWLVIVVGDGVDAPGELYWRIAREASVLDPAGDVVILVDDAGKEQSRFSYRRR